MRVDEFLRSAQSLPPIEAQMLAAHALGVDRTWILTHPEALIEPGTLLERRLSGEPLAYIVGEREFYGRTFKVDPGVLIPRHETEHLIDAVLGLGREFSGTILDIGTGSGCIAITLALELSSARVAAVDISSGALEVAALNAARLGASVTFFAADLLPDDRTWDVVVSNPPYVSPSDFLPADVRDFEPSLALFGGDDGLSFYRRLAHVSASRLFLEIGQGQGTAVTSLLHDAGWSVAPPVPDLAGIDRVIVATRD